MMGTNFYLIEYKHATDVDSMDPKYHIGKRSAAGTFCWDCQITLCKDGKKQVHSMNSEWYDACPNCGKTKEHNAITEGAVAVELGFCEPDKPDQKHGVRVVSSFTWAMSPDKLKGKRRVIDEYDREYTMKEFKENILGNCPIQFHIMIGRCFS